jgi:hypothetical protein
VASKLDLIVRRHVSELSFGEASMAALRRDVLRLAAQFSGDRSIAAGYIHKSSD